jgi:enoyl-[acyl-carrier protein] reductase II
MLTTPLSERFGLTLPVVSAGMAFVAGPRLAAAVSNAGGLGVLGGAMAPPEGLAGLVAATRGLTSRPFGVDLVTPFVEDGHIAMLAQVRPAVVVFFWGTPKQAWIARLQDAGIEVWMQVGRVTEALEAAGAGVDAIIAQGSEAGGHNRAEATTMTLLPAVIRAVAPLPVLAAGGIADGRALVAVVAMGAEAAWCGTRFLASEEADAHPGYKQAVVEAGVGDTVRTTLFGPEWPGEPVRALRNAAVRDWAGHEDEAARLPAEIVGETVIGASRVAMPRFSAILPTEATSGNLGQMCLTAGEAAGNIAQVLPAAAILEAFRREAADALHRLAGRSPRQAAA